MTRRKMIALSIIQGVTTGALFFFTLKSVGLFSLRGRTQKECLNRWKNRVVCVDDNQRLRLSDAKTLKPGDKICRSTVLVRFKPLTESISKDSGYEVGFMPGSIAFAPPHGSRTFFDDVPESEVIKVKVPRCKK